MAAWGHRIVTVALAVAVIALAATRDGAEPESDVYFGRAFTLVDESGTILGTLSADDGEAILTLQSSDAVSSVTLTAARETAGLTAVLGDIAIHAGVARGAPVLNIQRGGDFDDVVTREYLRIVAEMYEFERSLPDN